MTHAESARMKRVLIFTLILAGLSACAGQMKKTAAGEDQVYHIVLIWLNDPGDGRARRDIIGVSRSFSAIPGVLAVHAGTSLPSGRPIADDSFDIGIVITFPDRKAMQAYLTHPTHVNAVRDIIKPHIKRILVYDFQGS